MSIAARWIDKGYYVIDDNEYGFVLCRLNFGIELVEGFSEKQLELLANDIKKILIERLALENNENKNK